MADAGAALPDDLWLRILLRLATPCLCSAAQVCTKFRKLVSQDALWQGRAALFKRNPEQSWQRWVATEAANRQSNKSHVQLVATSLQASQHKELSTRVADPAFACQLQMHLPFLARNVPLRQRCGAPHADPYAVTVYHGDCDLQSDLLQSPDLESCASASSATAQPATFKADCLWAGHAEDCPEWPRMAPPVMEAPASTPAGSRSRGRSENPTSGLKFCSPSIVRGALALYAAMLPDLVAGVLKGISGLLLGYDFEAVERGSSATTCTGTQRSMLGEEAANTRARPPHLLQSLFMAAVDHIFATLDQIEMEQQQQVNQKPSPQEGRCEDTETCLNGCDEHVKSGEIYQSQGTEGGSTGKRRQSSRSKASAPSTSCKEHAMAERVASSRERRGLDSGVARSAKSSSSYPTASAARGFMEHCDAGGIALQQRTRHRALVRISVVDVPLPQAGSTMTGEGRGIIHDAVRLVPAFNTAAELLQVACYGLGMMEDGATARPVASAAAARELVAAAAAVNVEVPCARLLTAYVDMSCDERMGEGRHTEKTQAWEHGLADIYVQTSRLTVACFSSLDVFSRELQQHLKAGQEPSEGGAPQTSTPGNLISQLLAQDPLVCNYVPLRAQPPGTRKRKDLYHFSLPTQPRALFGSDQSAIVDALVSSEELETFECIQALMWKPLQHQVTVVKRRCYRPVGVALVGPHLVLPNHHLHIRQANN
eukprot:SM000063S19991  [mRNA]  locus=s63:103757:107527:- [translate_table: standard]